MFAHHQIIVSLSILKKMITFSYKPKKDAGLEILVNCLFGLFEK